MRNLHYTYSKSSARAITQISEDTLVTVAYQGVRRTGIKYSMATTRMKISNFIKHENCEVLIRQSI
jgi:hypothetical protein